MGSLPQINADLHTVVGVPQRTESVLMGFVTHVYQVTQMSVLEVYILLQTNIFASTCI